MSPDEILRLEALKLAFSQSGAPDKQKLQLAKEMASFVKTGRLPREAK